jgi:aminobenzoyl-glutamate transport protein
MTNPASPAGPRGRLAHTLDVIERVGNKLPDPALAFLLLLIVVALLSAWLSALTFVEIGPRSGEPIVVRNLLAPDSPTAFVSQLVKTLVDFPPLGVVLVAMLGIGVVEHTGFINAALRTLLAVTKRGLLTPVVITVGIVSHIPVDADYVLVIPLAGIAAAFAGVSGGFSAYFVPSSLDPMLSGISQAAAQILDPAASVNPLNNWFFTLSSSLLIIVSGWLLTDRVIEPRLAGTAIDGDPNELPE